jgi:hypothetical protein
MADGLPALEHDVIDAAPRELAGRRQPRRSSADYDRVESLDHLEKISCANFGTAAR